MIKLTNGKRKKAANLDQLRSNSILDLETIRFFRYRESRNIVTGTFKRLKMKDSYCIHNAYNVCVFIFI